jgi:hypothetical protein
MSTRDGKQSASQSKQTLKSTKPRAKKQVSPLRQRMICDMELAGYTQGTQQSYIGAVVKLQDHYTIRPDKLTEKQVQQYIFWLRDEKRVAQGTFQTNWAGIKFFYYHTLGVDWPLFTRKKVRQPLRKRLPVPIAWEDGHRLIAALQKPGYQLCCSFMLALGLRIGDVVVLPVDSIDATQMLVRVIGKRNKERVVPLPDIRVCCSPTAGERLRSARSHYAMPSIRPAIHSASPRPSSPIPCVTGLPRIYSKTASTSASYKCYSAMPASDQRRSTRI